MIAHYPYLIVGGGMTADAAVRAIRSIDENKAIGIISEEPYPPYLRPPLSKGLWKGRPVQRIWCRTESKKADLFLGETALALDLSNRRLYTDKEKTYSFEKLLIATGGRPRTLPFKDQSIIYYRNLADYYKLREITERAEHFGIIGGGFIGTEIASCLCELGKKVSMIFLEEGIGRRIFPLELSLRLNAFFEQKGVRLYPNQSVKDYRKEGDKEIIVSSTGQELVFDCVVAGLGIIPNVELAKEAGIKVENGIVVNEYLQTSCEGVYAAGDVANFYCPPLGKRLRVEHEDNARKMGECAGKAMAGNPLVYEHIPSFYSDFFNFSYESVGIADGNLPVISFWNADSSKGVLYYHDSSKLMGVLLWNIPGKVPEARALLSEGVAADPQVLSHRISLD
ncbi:NAD(P)/FAD-dependent oxidoreductase [Methylacidiphilum kamchatkense]|uniref:Pyridine nucleotide-disulfide oxidoreductase n=1 Tax=Methylacidiphilum kamchatkense Kam1 TaxID=1202785 RepID=A0A516TMN7_9BACT|nr:FAD-dependent oxidoreductase [Methylacidiphilum kamchatkense]QDQ42501.1 pyridine nucleotide-disulfide oxidoreductase [Methylacidiphilum kamchatkense Kam1]